MRFRLSGLKLKVPCEYHCGVSSVIIVSNTEDDEQREEAG